MSEAAPIDAQVRHLVDDFGLHPVTASEIEFYLHGSDSCPYMALLWEEVGVRCKDAGIGIYKIEKERGREQHEVALTPSNDPTKTARDTNTLKSIITERAKHHGLRADFSAKPLSNQPGSGLHIHLHLADKQGKNVFYKDDQAMSDPLKFSIGGLLATMQKYMPVFAPSKESYERFVPGGNAPTSVSWGANNRTVAVRLPDKPHDRKHIEHRVAGSDADPLAVMNAILEGIHYGLVNRCDPGAQIYGDAALPMYDLSKLTGG